MRARQEKERAALPYRAAGDELAGEEVVGEDLPDESRREQRLLANGDRHLGYEHMGGSDPELAAAAKAEAILAFGKKD